MQTKYDPTPEQLTRISNLLHSWGREVTREEILRYLRQMSNKRLFPHAIAANTLNQEACYIVHLKRRFGGPWGEV